MLFLLTKDVYIDTLLRLPSTLSQTSTEHVIKALKFQNIPVSKGAVSLSRQNLRRIGKFFDVATIALHNFVAKDERVFQTTIVSPFRHTSANMVSFLFF